MKLFILLSLLSLTGLGIAMEHNNPQPEFETNITIGKTLKANRYKNIYFSGQISPNEIQTLKEQGFKTIVNLRMPFEHDEVLEATIAKNSNMNYYNIPFTMNASFDEENYKAISQGVLTHLDEGKVLLHCASGNRVGIWVGLYFYQELNYSKFDALDTAILMGITKTPTLNQLKAYLEQLEGPNTSPSLSL